jgi:hypothetical protein
MLSNKSECAFELLTKCENELIVPDYIQEAILWIKQ